MVNLQHINFKYKMADISDLHLPQAKGIHKGSYQRVTDEVLLNRD